MSAFENAELFKELNASAEEAEIKRATADKIMSDLIFVRKEVENPDISKAKKKEFSNAIEKLKPLAKSAMTDIEVADEIFKKKVSTVASRTGESSVGVLRKLADYHHGAATDKFLKQLKFAQTLDIVFVYDITGSMAPYINLLSTHIAGIINDIKHMSPYIRPRLGLVGYRDPEDGSKHFEIYHLDESVTKFVTKLEAVKKEVGGGGDECEDVIGALDKAANFDWQHQNRIIFLCADAPCHGTKYHDGCDDRHPDGLKIDSEPILYKLIEKKVQIVFWKINNTTDKMIRIFNEEASRSPSQKAFPGDRPRDEFISQDLMNHRDPVGSMRTSIMRTLSTSLTTSRDLVKEKRIKHTLKDAAKKMASITEEEADAISIRSEMSIDVVKATGGGTF